MKKAKYVLGIVLSLFLFNACDNYAEFETEVPVNPVVAPVRGAWAQDGNGTMLEGMIDQEARTIVFSLYTLPDLTMVKVKLDIPKRCELVSPKTPECIIDLSKGAKVIVEVNGEEISYDVTAKLAAFRDFDVSGIKLYRCQNDCEEKWNKEANIKFEFLIDGKFMSGPGKYTEVGYGNYQVSKCPDINSEDYKNDWATVTMDFGEAIYLHKITFHPYWNVGSDPHSVIKYDMYAYAGVGEPDKSGDWSQWTKIGSFDYNKTPTVWPNGDSVVCDKDSVPKARYYRLRFIENWKKGHPETGWGVPGVYAYCEMQVSMYNKR